MLSFFYQLNTGLTVQFTISFQFSLLLVSSHLKCTASGDTRVKSTVAYLQAGKKVIVIKLSEFFYVGQC